MTPTVARLLLSMLLLSGTVAAYLVLYYVIYDTTSYDDFQANLIVGLVCYPVLVIAWTLIWFRAVRWTIRRIVLSMAALAASLLIGGAILIAYIIVAAASDWLDEDYATVVCVPIAMGIWPVATVFIWMDTLKDRAARSRAAQRDGVKCPGCGYGLSDIRSTTCPECGRGFTVRELVIEARGAGEL